MCTNLHMRLIGECIRIRCLQVIPNVALTSADLKEGDNTFTSVAGTPIVVRNS
jgi:hypothetical protein